MDATHRSSSHASLQSLQAFIFSPSRHFAILPAKLKSRFLLPIFSRQIDESISIADFFPLCIFASCIRLRRSTMDSGDMPNAEAKCDGGGGIGSDEFQLFISTA
jgi:hypothetical protein